MSAKHNVLAAELLERCAIWDRSTPTDRPEIVQAWGMMIEQAMNTYTKILPRSGHYGFTEDDLIQSVQDWYCHNSQSATINDLIKGARRLWQDRYDRGDPFLQAQYEELCNSKAARDDNEDEYPTPDPYSIAPKRGATDEERKAIESVFRKPE